MIYPNRRLLRLVLGGLLAALVFVASMMRITLPVNVGTTSFHLGNIMCALSGILLGPLWGGLAAGVGSMLYDFTNPLYIAASWITLLTKGAYGLVAGLVVYSGKAGQISYRRFTLAAVSGAAVYAVLYLLKCFAWDGLLLGGLQAGPAVAALVPKLPATLFNAAVAVIFAPILAAALQKALGVRYQRFTRN
jgi:uncharacterized membrane protein